MEIKEALNCLSGLIDSCYFALTNEEQEEITKIEMTLEKYFNSKTKYIVIEEEVPVCICDTLADAEEAVLTMVQNEAYEAYLWEVEDFKVSCKEFFESIMKYPYSRNKSLEFNVLASWGAGYWIEEIEMY